MNTLLSKHDIGSYGRRRMLVGATLLAAAAIFYGSASFAADAKRFVFANSALYDNLDPHQVSDVARVASRINLYDGLYRWQDNPPKLEPWLAESYAISPDGLVYTYKLRRGIKFHDGSEMTADDVVYSFDRLLAMGKGAASLVGSMVDKGNVKATDKYTVTFTLKRPAAIFLAVIPEIGIVNAALVKKNEKNNDWGAAWLASNDAGSGSYMLTRYDPAVGFQARRHKDHFHKWGDKYLEEIEFRSVIENSTMVLGLIRGDYHGLDGYLPIDQIKRIKAAPNTKVLEQESMRITSIQMNTTKPPFNDVNFRRAVSYAFDYNGMINGILSGSVQRNPGPTPNNMWGAPKDVKGYTFDMAKAKEELAKAKTKADRPLTIAFSEGQAPLQQQAEVLQAGLKQLGIETELKVMPWPNLQPLFRSAETSPDMFSTQISTYYPDPHNWIGEMYSQATRGTFKSAAYYTNPEVERLLTLGLTSTNVEVRRKAYEDAGRIVIDEAPGVFIYNTKWYGPYAKNVQGIRFCPIGNGLEMRWAYFE